MKTHMLKLDTRWFHDLLQDKKRAEIRSTDRDYQVGDTIKFVENGGLGRTVCATITHIVAYNDFPDGIQPGYAVLSVKVLYSIMNDKQKKAWNAYRKASLKLKKRTQELDDLGIDPYCDVCEVCGGPCGDGSLYYEGGVCVCGACEIGGSED